MLPNCCGRSEFGCDIPHSTLGLKEIPSLAAISDFVWREMHREKSRDKAKTLYYRVALVANFSLALQRKFLEPAAGCVVYISEAYKHHGVLVY